MNTPMLHQLSNIPGFTHLDVRRRNVPHSDRMWIASAPSHHMVKGDRNVVFGMAGRTIDEAVELLIAALKENEAKRHIEKATTAVFPKSRGTSAGELRRMHEEAEEAEDEQKKKWWKETHDEHKPYTIVQEENT